MTLKDKFSEAQESADFSALHGVFSGPSSSGKTTKAYEYARGLVAEGKAADRIVRVNCNLESQNLINHAFQGAKDGVLILDNIAYWQPGTDELACPLVEACKRNNCVLLLVGESMGVERFLKENQELAGLIPNKFTTPRSFSMIERDNYNAKNLQKMSF